MSDHRSRQPENVPICWNMFKLLPLIIIKPSDCRRSDRSTRAQPASDEHWCWRPFDVSVTFQAPLEKKWKESTFPVSSSVRERRSLPHWSLFDENSIWLCFEPQHSPERGAPVEISQRRLPQSPLLSFLDPVCSLFFWRVIRFNRKCPILCTRGNWL